MANYYGTSRSNYFKVKDTEAFIAEMSELNVEVWNDRDDERVGIYVEDGDSNTWPNDKYNEETQDYDDIEMTKVVAGHLVEGEVAILEEIGAEKLRYLCGYALAVNSKGETREVSLSNIVDLARELGPNVIDPSY